MAKKKKPWSQNHKEVGGNESGEEKKKNKKRGKIEVKKKNGPGNKTKIKAVGKYEKEMD